MYYIYIQTGLTKLLLVPLIQQPIKLNATAWLIYVVERNVSTHIYYSFDLSFRLVVYSVLLFSHEIQSWSDYFFLSLWHHLRENESRRIKCFIQSISRKHIYIYRIISRKASVTGEVQSQFSVTWFSLHFLWKITFNSSASNIG